MNRYATGEQDTDYLVEVMYKRHIVASRAVAKHFIKTGGVKVDGEIIIDPLTEISVDAIIKLIGRGQ